MAWKPDGYTALAPYLLAERPEEAAAFCQAVFGAERLRSEPGEAGGVHIELRIEDSVVMIGGPAGPSQAMCHLYCADPDAVMARAVDHGATVIEPLQDRADGDRRGGFQAPDGTQWFVARRL